MCNLTCILDNEIDELLSVCDLSVCPEVKMEQFGEYPQFAPENLQNMKYPKLKEIAKFYKIPANLKKVTLINAIIAQQVGNLDERDKIILECKMQRSKRKTMQPKTDKFKSPAIKKKRRSTPANFEYRGTENMNFAHMQQVAPEICRQPDCALDGRSSVLLDPEKGYTDPREAHLRNLLLNQSGLLNSSYLNYMPSFDTEGTLPMLTKDCLPAIQNLYRNNNYGISNENLSVGRLPRDLRSEPMFPPIHRNWVQQDTYHHYPNYVSPYYNNPMIMSQQIPNLSPGGSGTSSSNMCGGTVTDFGNSEFNNSAVPDAIPIKSTMYRQNFLNPNFDSGFVNPNSSNVYSNFISNLSRQHDLTSYFRQDYPANKDDNNFGSSLDNVATNSVIRLRSDTTFFRQDSNFVSQDNIHGGSVDSSRSSNFSPIAAPCDQNNIFNLTHNGRSSNYLSDIMNATAYFAAPQNNGIADQDTNNVPLDQTSNMEQPFERDRSSSLLPAVQLLNNDDDLEIIPTNDKKSAENSLKIIDTIDADLYSDGSETDSAALSSHYEDD